MITELFIEGSRVDSNADISSLLTFAIDDVKDFASRQTTFSKTVTIPGTGNNNKLFGNIFEIGSSNDYNPAIDNIGYNFNASISARVLIFQDYLQTFKGTLRLLQINKDKGNIEYETALNGELTSLSVALSSSKLEDLDFSAYDHSFDVATIVASWDNPAGSGYYYPLIDYGTFGRYLGSDGKHDWDIRTFRPALYVKEYIDKMFAIAEFRYESALFGTARFKGLIVPHGQRGLTHLSNQILSATNSSTTTILDPGTPVSVSVAFPTVIGTTFAASLGNTRFTYTPAASATMNMNASIFGSSIAQFGNYSIEIRLNGTLIPGQQYLIPPRGTTSSVPFSWSTSVAVGFNTGDYIEMVVWTSVVIFLPDKLISNTVGLGVSSVTAIDVPVNPGDAFEINSTLPKNIRQVDFLTSIVKLFNLYVYESQFDEKLILIKPFIDFYSTDSSNAVDWTYKLNRDQVITVKPMSELNSKLYKFIYKDDSDFYNEQYKKRYNQGYGSYIFDSEFEFASQTNTVELIFASTPLVGYAGEDKVYSTIYKKSGFTEETIDSVIRILQTKKVTGVSSWDIYDDITVLTSLTKYGYAGHFDDPDNPTNDLNFGVLAEIFFTLVTGDLTKTQFNLYWSAYMAEITDKDSKMLTAKFYLTPKDIFELDFSKYVYVDGVLFRLNKITDYNTTVPNDCQVQLLKVINTIY